MRKNINNSLCLIYWNLFLGRECVTFFFRQEALNGDTMESKWAYEIMISTVWYF